MDTRISPFGEHPDGGKISKLKEDEPIPKFMMPLSSIARKIIEEAEIPQEERVNFILNSSDERLNPEKEWLINRLHNMHIEDLKRLQKTNYV